VKLDRVLVTYRIGDPLGLHPIFDATGSTLAPGRWNTATSPMIYTCETYSTAMLEKLVHGNGIMPPRQHFIALTIPNGVEYEMVTHNSLPGWHEASCLVPKAFGEQWVAQQRSAILIVPSVVARMERNILINPAHPQAKGIACSLPEPVWWDARLFAP
jgi:RES domain-containing protein